MEIEAKLLNIIRINLALKGLITLQSLLQYYTDTKC